MNGRDAWNVADGIGATSVQWRSRPSLGRRPEAHRVAARAPWVQATDLLAAVASRMRSYLWRGSAKRAALRPGGKHPGVGYVSTWMRVPRAVTRCAASHPEVMQ